MLTGSNLLHTKQYNLRLVHEVIRLFGPLPRAEIARRTHLTGQTISNLTRELRELGLIVEGDRRQEGRGAPSTALAINPDGAFGIGLDFNRDHLTGLLLDVAGNVRHRVHVELEFPSPAETLELMVATVERLIAERGIARSAVCGVGVAIPGPMYPTPDGLGYLVNPRSFPGWHKVPLADWLQARLAMPVLLENDATAAAAGERWYGAGQRIGTFFYFCFGAGLGGGLVMNGTAFNGFTGNAGEIAYLPPVLAGDAGLGSGDDSEARSHVGAHFYLPRLYEALRRDGIAARTPADLDALYGAGHPALQAWMDTGADYLAGLTLAVEYLLDPEAIFFGGRLSERMMQALLDAVTRRLPGRRVPEKAATARLLVGTAGEDAAALGVATLPIHQCFSPAPQVLLKRGAQQATPAFAFGAHA
ncbi:ROK family protein [Gemmatirosa kalamazoonensis]|uniref:ROK family protein n=1 Tax=Gemmatirosa kalamazoonensis TaxID=861299 RepID=W0REU3_9BACT|nr:ROK family transcriptional regulator [Gemmatirosa kalamazoonensis]AHG87898.1 ROK family protein [Gemmatirosa kalamazoonensis]